MEVLLVHADKKVGSLLSFVIEANYRARVSYIPFLRDAIGALKAKPDYGLVVYTNTEERHDSFKEFLVSKNGRPSILITSEQKAAEVLDPDLVGTAQEDDAVANICELLQKLIDAGTLKPMGNETKESDFCRIPPEMLMEASPLEAPVYIRLSAQKFIKALNAGDIFDREDLEKYAVQKKLEFLYIHRGDVTVFADRFKKILSEYRQQIQAGEEISMDTLLDLTISSNDLIQELSRQLGYNEKIKELINENVDLTVQAMKQMPSLRELMARLERERDRYVSAHSTVLAFVACAMAKSMNFDSEGTFQKLTMAAYLHDIALTNHELAMVRNMEELEQVKFQYRPEEINAYEKHPEIAAGLAQAVGDKAPDVDAIIRQHHEFDEPGSFPQKLNAMQVSPLAALFIIAHEFVLSSVEGSIQNPAMIKELQKKFNRGNFKQVIKQINMGQFLK